MANPSSTSSKRLVGLGLRGIRNSPPTQMTAQIKSVLSHHSPRTSPTLSSSPTSPGNTINTNGTSPVTATTTSVPTSSIASTVTNVVSPNPRLRACGRLRSFQGTSTGASSNGITSANGEMGGTRSSPLVESFTPSGLGLLIPTVTASGQKGSARPPVPVRVDGAGDTEREVKKTSSEAPCQAVDGRREFKKLKEIHNGVISTPLTSATNICSGPGPDSGSRPSLANGDTDEVVHGGITSEGTLGDDTRYSVQHIQDSHKARTTLGDNEAEQQCLQTFQTHLQSRSSYAQTPIQQNSESHSSRPYGSGSTRLGTTALPTVSPRLPAHPFVDVPFPLHPEKTFRIHTSPLVGSPMNSTDAQLKTAVQSDVTPPPSLRSPALPTSTSYPFPSTSPSGARLSPKLSAAFKNLKEFSSTLSQRFSSPFSSTITIKAATTPRRISPSNSNTDSELALSPNTQRRMFKPINEDIYKSPPSPSSISSPILPSFERSPSTITLLSSRVHRLRRSEQDEEEESHREANYSTICSPSSSPFIHRRATSVSPSSSPSLRWARPGCSSPVAKIETILGPRERGIECIPERRNYRCSYSKLTMSPGSLTPLEEDKSLDLNAFMDEIEYRSLGENEGSNLNLGSEGSSSGGSTSRVSSRNGMPHGSQRSIPGLPVTSSPVSGSGPGSLVFDSVSGAKAVATTRAGLRRKVTGVSSPLAQCVATGENVSHRSLSHGDSVEFEGEEDSETPLSPRLMRAKDSLLLKDVQRKKKRAATTSGVEQVVGLIGQTIQGIPTSTSAPPGTIWDILSGRTPTVSGNSGAAEGVLLSLTPTETSPSSPNPFRSPSQSTPLVEVASLTPLIPIAQIQLPETPTIRPSTRTASGLRDLDDAISPLQLSSPTFPLTDIAKNPLGLRHL